MKKSVLFASIVLMAAFGPATDALQTEEVLDLVAMPLAVAAVSDVTGIPTESVVDLAVAMNDVEVPPAQFVEIVRYSPVLLVDPDQEREVMSFVRSEVDRGVSDRDLVIALRDRIRENGIEDIEIVEPRVVRDRQRIVPDRVIRYVDENGRHPHGGPPGQIKKEIGVQTGAEVVHGRHPGQDREGARERGTEPRRDRGTPERGRP
ncbi:MAG: hypothetical protein R3338_15585, partial [Thermoanaerobaculia bacterium]|nr:hypothetical protein [Thermoanaerobaculia bacterium]